MTNSNPQFFGTDGIRGTYGDFPINEAFFEALGRALTLWLKSKNLPLRILCGRDTRISGASLEQALAEGLGEESLFVSLGVISTPAISFLTTYFHATLGISITASHNPFTDNGIKIIRADGNKLSKNEELELESFLSPLLETPQKDTGRERIIAEKHREGLSAYLDQWEHFFPKPVLQGRKIVLDTANGATSSYAAGILERLGAEVISIFSKPDGENINRDCGSEHPEKLAEMVKNSGADAGLAVDGDGDRALLVDATGAIIAGEYLLSQLLLREGDALQSIVTTTQANRALDCYLESRGKSVIRCDVGDRNVAETMQRHGIILGGEPSGHVIYAPLSRLADGLFTGVAFLESYFQQHKGKFVFERPFELFPSVAKSFRVAEKIPLESLVKFQSAMQKARAILGENGRVQVRYSGTENKLRLLIEGQDLSHVEAVADELKQALRLDFGAKFLEK